MKAKQQGFTLVELVVVIVILGILAAVAIPRYAGFTKEARIAALNGLAGAIRSSVMVVQGRYIALGLTGAAATPVTMLDGTTTVAVSTTVAAGGIPTGAMGGIDNAVKVEGFDVTFAAGVATWDFPTPVTGCNVTYTAAGAVVAVVSTSC
jgi:MSHA pilin protein MshA